MVILCTVLKLFCCFVGFYGQYCENDINECEDPVAVCGDKAKCINTIGNYTCECGRGLCGFGCNVTNPCNVSTACYQLPIVIILVKKLLVLFD